ncbi:unnamed protein product [Adineta steineri]|uniref:Uncharacterized protein n=1 Tax=Adineta steineri TaxID=433720 RepID=A0A814EG06_9BILA|nr:unnamed protein product [Adineta steineri]
MDVAEEDNFDMFFINATRQLVRVQDGKHAEWVLFHHGSLFIQTMSNNEETPTDELINKAKESLSKVIIAPGTVFGDATIYNFDYENKKNYFICLYEFPGVILIHPSQQVTQGILAMHCGRTNVLND